MNIGRKAIFGIEEADRDDRIEEPPRPGRTRDGDAEPDAEHRGG